MAKKKAARKVQVQNPTGAAPGAGRQNPPGQKTVKMPTGKSRRSRKGPRQNPPGPAPH